MPSSATATEAPRSLRPHGRPPKRLAILAASVEDQADGVRDYTTNLIAELQSSPDWDVSLHLHRGADARNAPAHGLTDADVVLIQYSPFWFGRRGFAPSLPAAIWRARRSASRPVIALMLHETFVDMTSWRFALMGAWQRAQLLSLQAASDVQFCSTEAWMHRARTGWPAPSMHHLPVASNFPDARSARAGQRDELGVTENTLVLTCFGMSQAGRSPAAILAAAGDVAREGHDVVVLNLGTGERGIEPREGFTIRRPGFLEPADAARMVAASDIFLAPYHDGVSTRRTTVMTALQHGVAVVGTDGKFTDRILRDASGALSLVPIDRPDLFARAVCRLADDRAAREATGAAGRELYEEQFDWPRLTARLLSALEPLVGRE